MKKISSSVRKDILEFIRCKRMLLCLLLIFAVFVISLISAFLIPAMLEFISKEAPSIISESFKEDKQLLSGVKGIMGIFAANTMLFYLVTVCFVYSRILPSEIKSGKWIIPLNVGYSEKEMLFSKSAVYGIFTSAAPFLGYILYYFVTSYFTKNNMSFMHLFINAVIMAFIIFVCIVCVIMLSYILMNGIGSAITVISLIVAAPDILSLFPFGKYLPTYLFTFLYNSYEPSLELLPPLIFTVAAAVLLALLCIRKTSRRIFYTNS